MKPIAVFIENYNIDYSASIVNLLDFLSAVCRVDLFLRNVQMKNSPVLGKSAIRLIEIRRPFHWRTAAASARQRLANFVKGHWRSAFLPSRSARGISRRFANRDYHCHIAFDAPGMVLCKELFPQAKPFYYSLELTLLSEAASATASSDVQLFLEKERSWSRDIRGLIIQSREREQLFRIDHSLHGDIPVLYLPVTYQGPPAADRKNVLQQRYGIPPYTRVAIHLGGVNPYFSSLAIAEAFTALPGWYLFFQGNHLRGYREEIRRMVKRKGARNVIVSKRFFTRLEKIDEYVQSADVGIVWYNELNANFRTAGFSSGKISAYMRCGLPILANNLSSMQAMVAQKGSGVCIERMDQIPAALQKISENYQAFRSGSLREYESRYRFENYQQSIRNFLDIK